MCVFIQTHTLCVYVYVCVCGCTHKVLFPVRLDQIKRSDLVRWEVGCKGGGRKERTDPRETMNDISLPYKIRCSYDGVEDKRIMGMQLDKASSSLYVAFSTCVIKVPLGRCERHGKCKKYVFALLIISKSTVLRKES